MDYIQREFLNQIKEFFEVRRQRKISVEETAKLFDAVAVVKEDTYFTVQLRYGKICVPKSQVEKCLNTLPIDNNFVKLITPKFTCSYRYTADASDIPKSSRNVVTRLRHSRLYKRGMSAVKV